MVFLKVTDYTCFAFVFSEKMVGVRSLVKFSSEFLTWKNDGGLTMFNSQINLALVVEIFALKNTYPKAAPQMNNLGVYSMSILVSPVKERYQVPVQGTESQDVNLFLVFGLVNLFLPFLLPSIHSHNLLSKPLRLRFFCYNMLYVLLTTCLITVTVNNVKDRLSTSWNHDQRQIKFVLNNRAPPSMKILSFCNSFSWFVSSSFAHFMCFLNFFNL